MPARRISFVNSKGGVGKTSVAVNVAACLAYDLNKRVLVVDCDAQCNASIWLMGMGPFIAGCTPDNTLYGLLKNQGTFIGQVIRNAVVCDRDGQVLIRNLDLLPSFFELMNIEDEFSPSGGMDAMYGNFHTQIIGMSQAYDYIIFDCPPNVYRASKAAIFASEEIYIPCNPDALSNMGLALLRKKLMKFFQDSQTLRSQIQQYRFPKIRGVVLNKVPTNANIESASDMIRIKIQSFQQYSNIASSNADVVPTTIRHAVAAMRTVQQGLPLIVNPNIGNPNLLEDYIKLGRYIESTP